jgi:hypothetical protein
MHEGDRVLVVGDDKLGQLVAQTIAFNRKLFKAGSRSREELPDL